VASVFLSEAQAKTIYQDPTQPIERRVEDLVKRMTLEEKVAQMASGAPAIARLGIPAYDWQNECLHGIGKIGDYKVTVFPQPVGLAATWDAEGIRDMASCIADEGRAIYNDAISKGNHSMYYGLTYWSPNINIFRDPRWGRGHETFGEDPYMTGVLGKMFVEGLEGDDPVKLKASACAKHYAVHSGPETVRHKFNVAVSDRDLWETYLPAFRDLIVDAKVSGVMCAYNAFSGKPCCGNDRLMMDILRNKWEFAGYVTSDCGAIDDFYSGHKTHPDTISAATDAVLHGTDLDCIRDVTFKTLVRAVKEGRLPESNIDEAVKRLFTIRFRLGMFDRPDNLVDAPDLSVVDNEEHKALARKLARESVVLLKNDGILPLNKELKKIAVVGPNADNKLAMLGNYNGYPSEISTVLDGIRSHVSPSTEVYCEKMLEHVVTDNFLPLYPPGDLYADGRKGFKAEYFNNATFSGEPVVEYLDSIDVLNIGTPNVPEAITSRTYTVRYTTTFIPDSTADYTLNLNSDKRFKYSVNGKVCIDAMNRKGKANGLYTARFEAGKKYDIEIEALMKGLHAYVSFNIGKMVPRSYEEMAQSVADADVIIFAGGISPALEGEQNGVSALGFDDGDRTSIMLPAVQTELMKALKETGKPVVFVMMTGSAIASPWEDENLPAIVNGWYGGQAGGEAIADVLFGDYNPSGKLPVTFYATDADLPDFTDYSMDGRTYRYFKGKPLYPFGHGLSYTTFEYDSITAPESVATTGETEVTVKVRNSGDRAGDEVVQLYLTYPESQEDAPLRALKGFQRVHLEPGESKELTFTLTPREFARYDNSEGIVVYPGTYTLIAGGSQPDSLHTKADNSTVSSTLNLTGNTLRLPY
ncbi:MAG: glycoside hydrolase family 3 C-terminal domain-containing protein, partial [Muribaculaceae bacterium]|nr:glycoside hydrolase family 3 C-terminal domain-containing protein [Muribaculaceae bacterium]